MRFGEEEQSEEPEVTGRLAEERIGRRTVGLVPGGDERCWTDETSKKGKGKGHGGKGEHEGKGGGFGNKGKQQKTREEREESGEEEKREIQGMRWTDCDDEERMEEEEQQMEEKGGKRVGSHELSI